MYTLEDLFGIQPKQEYKAKVENNNLILLDDEYKSAVNKIRLSPSFINNWLASPGDAIMEKIIVPDLDMPEAIYLTRGTWFHSIMEHFFMLEPEERTLQNLKRITQKITKEDEKYSTLIKDQENRDWLNNALIQGYWKTWGEEFKNDKIANIFLMGETRKGLELFVSGKIGNTERNCLGFIDKLVESEGGLKVQDWKTGKKINNYDPTRKISNSNSFDYWRQQLIYTILLEQNNFIVKSASLIFPCAEIPQEVFVDVNLESAREKVVNDVEQTDKEITMCIENNYTFPFKAGIYNSWATYLCGLGSAYKPSNLREDKLLSILKM